MKYNQQIINSMIRITQQRDLDSLEFGLVAAIAETVPATSIELLRIMNDLSDEMIEQVIYLSIDNTKTEDNKYIWDKNPKIIKLTPAYIQCMTDDESCDCNRLGIKHGFMIPVTRADEPRGLLIVRANQDVSGYRYIVEGLVKVYQNYLLVLHESEFDSLTGLRNRRTFDRKIELLLRYQYSKLGNLPDQEIINKRTYDDSDSPWLVVLDIDHFKKINDTFGHVYGDEVLLLLAQKMKAAFRYNDILFRFGGEEFVIILEAVSKDMASNVLQRFRQSIEDFQFPQVGQVTISGGYAQIKPNDFPVAILENADKALYYAKQHGRNKICNYEQLVEAGLLKTVDASGEVELF